MFGTGQIKFFIHDGIAGGILVHIGRAVTNPLTGHKDGQFNVQFDFAHFKRGCVPVAHQIPNQPPILLHLFCAAAVRHAGGLRDGGIIAHIINHPHKPMIQNGQGFVQQGFDPIGNSAARGVGVCGFFCGHGGQNVFQYSVS